MCFDRSCPWLESDYEPLAAALPRRHDALQGSATLLATSSLPVPSLVKLGLARVAELFDVAPGYLRRRTERARSRLPTDCRDGVRGNRRHRGVNELAVKAFEWTAATLSQGHFVLGRRRKLRRRGAVEDVTCLNGHIAEIVVASAASSFLTSRDGQPDESGAIAARPAGAHPRAAVRHASSTLSVAKSADPWPYRPPSPPPSYTSSGRRLLDLHGSDLRRDWWTSSTRRRWTRTWIASGRRR
jgi:hypothetical protein